MKNTPLKTSRKGKIWAAISWTYTDSEITIPARNAPIARESPHHRAIHAVPRMRHITVIARISRLFSRMTSLRRSGITKRDASRMTATPTPALASVNATVEKCAVSHCRNEGMSSIIGITAMSWNRRMPIEIFPWPLSISIRSAYTFSTIAVLERDKTNPMKIASARGNLARERTATVSRIVAESWIPPPCAI